MAGDQNDERSDGTGRGVGGGDATGYAADCASAAARQAKRKPSPAQAGPLAVRPGYEVGYAKPPVAGRFAKGQSGNPRGRPKGSTTRIPELHEQRLRTIILEEAYRTIAVREGDRTVTVPMAQAVLRSVAVSAVKGQHRSQWLFAELLGTVEANNRVLHDAYFEASVTYKRDWTQELARRRALGITDLPDPLPHPDHIKVNVQQGTIEVNGPWTEDEKVFEDHWRNHKRMISLVLADLYPLLDKITDPDERAEVQRHTATNEKLLARLERDLPG